MGIEETLNNLPQEVKEDILKAFKDCYNQLFINQRSYKFLKDLFSEYVEKIDQDCSRCKRRIIAFWKRRLEIWKML